MAKKSGLKIKYDSPVVLSFVLVSALILILDSLFLKGYLTKNVFICFGNKAGEDFKAFDYKNIMDYLRLVLHVFGSTGGENLLVNATFLLLLGPVLEERYGSLMLLLMFFVTSLVSGVLNACAVPGPVTGASCIVFMMICLASITAFSKKDVPVSWLLVFLLYLSLSLISSYKSSNGSGFSKFLAFLTDNIGTFTNLVAGIIGSLFGFLVSPKKRVTKAEKTDTSSKAKTTKAKKSSFSSSDDDDSYSYSRKSSASSSSSSDDETVIGTIEL